VTASARLPWFIAIPFMVLWLAVMAVAAALSPWPGCSVACGGPARPMPTR